MQAGKEPAGPASPTRISHRRSRRSMSRVLYYTAIRGWAYGGPLSPGFTLRSLCHRSHLRPEADAPPPDLWQKVSSSLTLRHSACVIHLTSPPHVRISSSHIIKRRGKDGTLRSRETTFNFYYRTLFHLFLN